MKILWKTTRVLQSNKTALWISHKTASDVARSAFPHSPKHLTAIREQLLTGWSPMHSSCPHQALCTLSLCQSLCLFHHRAFKADVEQRRSARRSLLDCMMVGVCSPSGTSEIPYRNPSERPLNCLAQWEHMRQAENPILCSRSCSNLAKVPLLNMWEGLRPSDSLAILDCQILHIYNSYESVHVLNTLYCMQLCLFLKHGVRRERFSTSVAL